MFRYHKFITVTLKTATLFVRLRKSSEGILLWVNNTKTWLWIQCGSSDFIIFFYFSMYDQNGEKKKKKTQFQLKKNALLPDFRPSY